MSFFFAFLKINPKEAMDENLFQWVDFPAQAKFSYFWRKLSSWVKVWSSDKAIIALP
jgi:hypothetical protein